MSANKKRKPRGKTISTEHLSQEEKEAHEKRLLYQREYQRRRYQERKNQPKDKESKFGQLKLGQKKSDESNQKSCSKRKSPANSAAKLNETRLERLERLERRALNMKKKNRPYREKLRRLIEQEQKLVALVNDKLTEFNNEDADKTEDEVDSLINQSTESCQDETKDDEIDDIDKKDDIQRTNESKDIKEHCQEEEVSKNSGKIFDDIIDLDTEPEVVVNNNFSDSFPKFFNINHRKFKPQHWIVPSKSIDVIELDCDTETPNPNTTTTSNQIELIDLDSDSDRPEEEEEDKNKSSNCSRVSVISFASNDSGFNDFKDEESPEAATSSNPQQPFWTKKFWLLKHNLETSREADQDQSLIE